MHINEKIKEINTLLEEGMTYEDWDFIEDAQTELLLLLRDLDSDFPIDFDDY